MEIRKKFEEWLESEIIDAETKNELKEIKDEKEIEDRFYQDLSFGTAGLRGVLGAGTNRMNNYTVGLASQAFAEIVSESSEDACEKGLAIAYDVRHKSKDFAELAARIFAANGVKVYLYNRVQPTPILSWTVRYLKTKAGLMITASHNPREYNGYKAYWEEGSQILEDIASKIETRIKELKSYDKIKLMDLDLAVEKGLIQYIDEKVYNDYISDVLNHSLSEDINKDISIVYSPLNGTGNLPVQEVLSKRGFTNVHIVEEQEKPDPDFTSVGYPNPEDPKAFKLSEELGRKVAAQILVATDPDSDRVAMEILDKDGNYEFINGNKIGALLVNYILDRLDENNKLPEKGIIVKSIVTGDLSRAIADSYGLETVETLTGFKNIAGVANALELSKEKTFIFGYEESIGYTFGDSVRDKDAVNSTMLIAEMAAYYDKRGMSLLEILDGLFEKYGYFNEELVSITLPGLDGKEKIGKIMEDFRNNPLVEIESLKLTKTIDYSEGYEDLPKSNVLKYYYNDGSWFALRPSGTEPKIKLYIYTVGRDLEDSLKKIKLIRQKGEEKMLS